MRVPYVVGRWVRGVNHYGRRDLIEHLLTIQDNAVWVVSTRRMGKTSLLRQIEFLTAGKDDTLVPLDRDIQGCESSRHLTEELLFAIEDVLERFEPFGVRYDDLAKHDTIGILRRLNRCLVQHDRQLLLLIDEAEALINIGEQEGAWLARLRKTFQSSQQRTIVTATKLLARLNDDGGASDTSPFLFGFKLVNIWSLDPESATSLVCQSQTNQPVQADAAIVKDILLVTNQHPYLMQYLCQRLFISDQGHQGSLRSLEEADLVPDQLLAGFFHINFQHLAEVERRILLIVGEMGVVSEEELFAEMPDQRAERIRTLIYGMKKLGYIRQISQQWTVGNELLRRWLHDHMYDLSDETPSRVSDQRVEELVRQGAAQELAFLREKEAMLHARLTELERLQATQGSDRCNNELRQEIERIHRELSTIRYELSTLSRGPMERNSD